jgi:hypothetical protein
VLLLLEALPDEAEPPLVLFCTVALPEVAVWSLVLQIDTSLLLVTVTLLTLIAFTLLCEPGPVVLIEPLTSPPPIAPIPAHEPLLTEAETLVLLLLEAAPDDALPALVLFSTVALPDDALWLLLFDARRLLVLVCLNLLILFVVT